MALFTQDSLIFRLLKRLAGSDDNDNGQSWLDEISVEKKGEVTVLSSDNIHLVEAHGDGVSISATSGTYLKPGTISSFERELDPAKFVRIHRTTIININKIVNVSPLIAGRFRFEISNGSTVTSSLDYQEAIGKALPEFGEIS